MSSQYMIDWFDFFWLLFFIQWFESDIFYEILESLN